MLYTHHYFADKIRRKSKDEQDKYSKTMAKAQVESLKNLMKKYPQYQASISPPDKELQEYYADLYKKQFEGLDKIAEALRLESWLSNTMFLFFVAITLFLATGVFPYLSILEYSLSTFPPVQDSTAQSTLTKHSSLPKRFLCHIKTLKLNYLQRNQQTTKEKG